MGKAALFEHASVENKAIEAKIKQAKRGAKNGLSKTCGAEVAKLRDPDGEVLAVTPEAKSSRQSAHADHLRSEADQKGGSEAATRFKATKLDTLAVEKNCNNEAIEKPKLAKERNSRQKIEHTTA